MLKTAGTIERISQGLSGDRELFLIFDRDGTLVPFCDNPDDAVFDLQVRESLNRLAGCPGVHVGLLSARSIGQLCIDLPDRHQILAGNYGLEIELPDGARFCHPEAKKSRIFIERAMVRLQENLPAQLSAIIEDHGLSLCLHWHRTPVSLLEQFHDVVGSIAADFPELRFKALNTSYEVWPDLVWDKSHGLAAMLQLANLAPEKVMLLFAGDSLVDEPAFAWVNQYAGITILVGKRVSEAKYALDTPAQLHELISRLEQQLH